MKLLSDGAEFVADDGDYSFRRRLGVPVHGQGEAAEVGADAGEVAVGSAFVEALRSGDDDGALTVSCQVVE